MVSDGIGKHRVSREDGKDTLPIKWVYLGEEGVHSDSW